MQQKKQFAIHFIRLTRFVTVVALAGTSLIATQSASAQLGRLKKAAGDAAKDAAGVKPANKDAGTENYPITVERLDAVIPTLEAAVADARRDAALKEATADYDKAHKAQQACLDAAAKAMMAGGRPPAMTPEKGKQMAAAATASMSMTQRTMSAQQAKRYRETVALQDSLAVAGLSYNMLAVGIDTKCGKPVYKSALMLDDEAEKMQNTSGQSVVSQRPVAPAARLGMTMYQFGQVRERAALWALQQTGNAPVGNNKWSVFTTAEQSALESRGDRLKKLVPTLKDQSNVWTRWSDLVNW